MTVSVSSPPYWQFWTAGGVSVLSGGLLFTYVAGTTTKQNTWTDSTQVTPSANPIVLDSNGIAVFWADPTLKYKYVVAPVGAGDPPSSTLYTFDNVSPPLTQATLTAFNIYPQTAAEAAAGVTPTNFSYPGNASWAYLSRYGGNLVSAIAVAAQQLIIGTNFTILVDTAVTLAASATVTSTTNLVFLGAGTISVGSTFTLTVNGMVAGPKTYLNAFTGAGSTVLNGDIHLYNKFALYGAAYTPSVNVGTSGTAFTISCQSGNAHYMTMNNNVALNSWSLASMAEGQTVNVLIAQDTTGGRTLANGSGLKWPGGTVGVLSTAANAVDLLTVTQLNGTQYATLIKTFS